MEAGESGRDSYIYNWGATLVSNRQTRQISENVHPPYEFRIPDFTPKVVVVIQFLALSGEYSLQYWISAKTCQASHTLTPPKRKKLAAQRKNIQDGGLMHKCY